MIGRKETLILLPAFNPAQQLSEYVQGLLRAGFQRIIIVNDGSAGNAQAVFDRIEEMAQGDSGAYICILKHAVNLGKGRALKTGINYYLVHLNDKYAGSKGIVTVDSDGQHLVEDVSKISECLEHGQAKVILGCRDFNMGHVPAKSRFGNQMTRVTVGLLFGKKVTDTQTGLRAFSNEVLADLLAIITHRLKADKTKLMRWLIVCVPSVTYFLFVAESAVYVSDRYLFPVYAVALGILLCALAALLLRQGITASICASTITTEPPPLARTSRKAAATP